MRLPSSSTILPELNPVKSRPGFSLITCLYCLLNACTVTERNRFLHCRHVFTSRLDSECRRKKTRIPRMPREKPPRSAAPDLHRSKVSWSAAPFPATSSSDTMSESLARPPFAQHAKIFGYATAVFCFGSTRVQHAVGNHHVHGIGRHERLFHPQFLRQFIPMRDRMCGQSVIGCAFNLFPSTPGRARRSWMRPCETRHSRNQPLPTSRLRCATSNIFVRPVHPNEPSRSPRPPRRDETNFFPSRCRSRARFSPGFTITRRVAATYLSRMTFRLVDFDVISL